MTIRIHNLTKFLKLFRSSNSEYSLIELKKSFEFQGIEKGLGILEFESLLDFCTNIDLVELDNEKFRFTELGKNCIDQTELEIESLKKFLIYNCILDGKLSKKIIKKIFEFESSRHSFNYNLDEIESHFGKYANVLPLLYEIEFLNRKISKNLVIINPVISSTIQFKNQIKSIAKISLSEQDKRRERNEKQNKIIGQIAEEIVLEDEIERLNRENHSEEAKNVRIISDDDSNAGYDIESFTDGSQNLNEPDKFIEVKGSTNSKLNFYWSKNEINNARHLGDKYWIFFVSNIDKNTKKGTITRRIKNPFQEIDPLNLDSTEFNKECQSYLISEN